MTLLGPIARKFDFDTFIAFLSGYKILLVLSMEHSTMVELLLGRDPGSNPGEDQFIMEFKLII